MKHSFLSHTCTFITFFVLYSSFASCEVSPPVANALLEFWNSTNTPGWIQSDNWGVGDPCLQNWYGVNCTLDHRVTSLTLIGNKITGTIPSSFGDLVDLVSLEIYNNTLSNTIPPSICNLTKLKTFSLYQNKMNGTLPSCITNLAAVEYFNVHSNTQLTGTIPEDIGKLQKLDYINLDFTKIYGTIPKSFGELNISRVYLHDLLINGSIPDIFQNLTRLSILILFNTQLTGTLPPSLTNSPSIANMRLDNLALTGVTLESFVNMTNLAVLNITNANVSGTIPPSITRLTRMRTLNADGNNITGTIPPTMANMTALNILTLSDNKLQGTPPDFIQYLPTYNLKGNYFTLPLPSWCNDDAKCLTAPYCGDGIVSPGEQCDTHTITDACCDMSVCMYKTGSTVCANNTVSGDGCSSSGRCSGSSGYCTNIEKLVKQDVCGVCGGNNFSCPNTANTANSIPQLMNLLTICNSTTNDVIYLSRTTYYIVAVFNISRPCTIRGLTQNEADVIIDCNNISTLGVHIAVPATVSGITIQNCHIGMRVTSDATIDNCIIRRNVLGIQVQKGNVSVIHSKFTENSAPNNSARGSGLQTTGGAETNITVIGSSFYKNTGFYGGGAYLSSGFFISNCSFFDNYLQNYGGALDIGTFVTTGRISNCTFTNNSVVSTSSARGGAISVRYATPGLIIIDNCKFYKNFAGDRGAGVFNQGNISIINCVYENNTSNAYGGGIFATGVTYIYDTLIKNNSARTGGGGIFVSINSNYVSVSKSTLIENTSDEGGGIYIRRPTDIENSTIANNVAGIGGGIYIWNGANTIKTTTVSYNIAQMGGGVYIANATTRMAEFSLCDISNNIARKGFIAINTTEVDVDA